MSEKNVVSPFQIVDWRILTFSSTNSIVTVPNSIEHHWKINAHIEKIPSDNNELMALLNIEFHFWAELGGQRNSMDGDCVTMCRLDLSYYKSKDEADKSFDRLVSNTAMVNSLSNLRVFLLQTGLIQQMSSKSIMLPYINLNNFSFDQDIELLN